MGLARIEFGVHGVTTLGPQTCAVIGRCFKGPISVGDTFTGIRRALGPAVDLHLVVVGIEAYRHDLPNLDQGLTARLRLEGRHDDTMVDGTVLFAD